METANQYPFQVIIYIGTGDEKCIYESYSTEVFTDNEENKVLEIMNNQKCKYAEVYFDNRDDESYSELYGTIESK